MSVVELLEKRWCGLCPNFCYVQQERHIRTMKPCTWRRIAEECRRTSFACFDVERVEGRFLLTAAENENKIYIFDLHNTNGKPDYNYEVAGEARYNVPESSSIRDVYWYAHDTGVFVTGGGKGIGVWDTNRMKRVGSFSTKHTINKVDVSHIATKHNLVAAACSGKETLLLDLNSGSLAHRLAGHKSEINTCRWSQRDEYVLATGCTDGQILLWDVRASKKKLVSLDNLDKKADRHSEKKAHRGIVYSLVFSSDGLDLYSYGSDSKVRKWDAATGKKSKLSFPKLTGGSMRRVTGIDIAISRNTIKDLLFVPRKNYIVVLDVMMGEVVTMLEGHFAGALKCLFHPFLAELYSIGENDTILTWLTLMEWNSKNLDDMGENLKPDPCFVDSDSDDLEL